MTDPTMPELPKMRAEFEASMRALDDTLNWDTRGGEYVSIIVRYAWAMWQTAARGTACAQAGRVPLTEEQIVGIRDDHLPSQGESFDCIAFARTIERAHGIGGAAKE
jgi:hypothetical protein